jgi:hypothetical protein
LREPFDERVRHARGGADREVERGGVGDAGAVGIGDGDFPRGRELDDLMTDAVHEHDLDAERAQHGDVDEEVAEILVGDDGAIDRDDENLPVKTGDVLQDAAEVRGLDRRRVGGRSGGGRGVTVAGAHQC